MKLKCQRQRHDTKEAGATEEVLIVHREDALCWVLLPIKSWNLFIDLSQRCQRDWPSKRLNCLQTMLQRSFQEMADSGDMEWDLAGGQECK